MSCIRYLFTKKKKTPRIESEVYSILVGLEGPLPEKDAELNILQHHLGRRMSFLNQKSNTAYANAAYAQQKGDIAKYLRYMNERKRFSAEIKKVGFRLTEVVEKRNELSQYVPPATKLETQTVNPVRQLENVTDRSPTEMVSSRSLDRSHTHIADILPPPPSDLYRGT